MRKILILLTCLFVLNVYSQNRSISKIPKKVVEAFERDFPNLIQYKWSKCLHNELNPIERDCYEVTFLFQSHKYLAKYDFEGIKIETIKSLSISEVNKQILEFINSKYSKYSIVSVREVTEKELVKIYKVEISDNKDDFAVLFFDDKFNYIGEIPVD